MTYDELKKDAPAEDMPLLDSAFAAGKGGISWDAWKQTNAAALKGKPESSMQAFAMALDFGHAAWAAAPHQEVSSGSNARWIAAGVIVAVAGGVFAIWRARK